MRTILLAAVAALSFTSAAVAAEGGMQMNRSQFVGVPAGFNNGTPQGTQAQALARYFHNRPVQYARAHQANTSVANTQGPQNRG